MADQGSGGDRFQRAFDAAADADDLQRDALIGIQAHLHPRLDLLLGQQGRPQQDGGNQARLLPDPQAAAGKQFVHADNRPIAIKAQPVHDGKGLVEQDAAGRPANWPAAIADQCGRHNRFRSRRRAPCPAPPA